MRRIHFGVLVLAAVLKLPFSGVAQTTDQPIDSLKIGTVAQQQDSTKRLNADTLSTDNFDFVYSDKLDSMVNTWYVQNAFAIDSINKSVAIDSLQIDLPDSVYISRLQDLDSYVPLPYNETVKKFINFYLNKRRGILSVMMGLSNYYFPLFEEVLAKYDLPLELKYLPIIESALNPKIVSRAGASGLWQFMLGTGKMYGLEVNSYIDERNDPIKATEAAARYLRDLYTIYGDWHVVIAAYNCGPGNINKAVRRSGGRQSYWEIYNKLPRETRGYIPVFIAANYVMNYAQEHHLAPVQPSFKIVTDTLIINNYLHFEQIASVINISVQEIRQLNPQYKRDIIPARADKPFVLKLPVEKISPFIDNQTQIFAYNRDKYFPNNQLAVVQDDRGVNMKGKKRISHTVKEGESLNAIASRFHVSTVKICEWNHLRHGRTKVGQSLTLYVNDKMSIEQGDGSDTGKGNPNDKRVTSQQNSTDMPAEKGFVYYIVQSGDNLASIAKQFTGVSDAEIRSINNIKNDRTLSIGQRLKIPVKA